MFNNISDRESQTFDFNGFYRGVVVENNDPKQAGRIKVNVFGVFDNIPVDNIPWAIMADPFMGGLGDNGSSFIPEIDSHVFVFFENGDHEEPVYFAGAPAIKDGEPDLPLESREEGEYPHNKVFKTKRGSYIEFDDTEDAVRIKIHHPSGTNREIDNDGNVIETIVGDETVNFDGDRTESIEGNSTESIEGDKSESVEGDKSESIGGDFSNDTSGDINVSSGGGTTIDVGADGTITVNGDMTIDANGNVNITGGGVITIEGALVNIN